MYDPINVNWIINFMSLTSTGRKRKKKEEAKSRGEKNTDFTALVRTRLKMKKKGTWTRTRGANSGVSSKCGCKTSTCWVVMNKMKLKGILWTIHGVLRA
jgi:hypothetical protein